jgi:hypothetical protein
MLEFTEKILLLLKKSFFLIINILLPCWRKAKLLNRFNFMIFIINKFDAVFKQRNLQNFFSLQGFKIKLFF